MKAEKANRKKVIGWIGFIRSLVIGITLGSFGYRLLGGVVAFTGIWASAMYIEKVKMSKKNDERAQLVYEKAGTIMFIAIFPVLGASFLIISISNVNVSAQEVLGPIFVLCGITYAVSYCCYNRKYK
jgi:hypothetical protein